MRKKIIFSDSQGISYTLKNSFSFCVVSYNFEQIISNICVISGIIFFMKFVNFIFDGHKNAFDERYKFYRRIRRQMSINIAHFCGKCKLPPFCSKATNRNNSMTLKKMLYLSRASLLFWTILFNFITITPPPDVILVFSPSRYKSNCSKSHQPLSAKSRVQDGRQVINLWSIFLEIQLYLYIWGTTRTS